MINFREFIVPIVILGLLIVWFILAGINSGFDPVKLPEDIGFFESKGRYENRKRMERLQEDALRSIANKEVGRE